jgi:hypothetical protein
VIGKNSAQPTSFRQQRTFYFSSFTFRFTARYGSGYQLNLDQKRRVKSRFGYHQVHLRRRKIEYLLETKHFRLVRWGWYSRGQHIRRRLGLHQAIRSWKREAVCVHMQPEKPRCRASSILSPTEIRFAQEEIPARVDGVNAIWTSGQSQ